MRCVGLWGRACRKELSASVLSQASQNHGGGLPHTCGVTETTAHRKVEMSVSAFPEPVSLELCFEECFEELNGAPETWITCWEGGQKSLGTLLAWSDGLVVLLWRLLG